jgi:thiol peroxidase
MAQITLNGKVIHTSGTLPAVGTQAPEFSLTNADMADVGLAAFAGKKKLLNIVPSLDTGICATSARTFSGYAQQHSDAVMLTISADLPFAQKRFCASENVPDVVLLSMFRDKQFAQSYGLLIVDGPLAGLLARAVVVLDADNQVVYSQLVPEIVQEPDYTTALAALK